MVIDGFDSEPDQAVRVQRLKQSRSMRTVSVVNAAVNDLLHAMYPARAFEASSVLVLIADFSLALAILIAGGYVLQ
jgi:hypothetical protein